MLGRINQPKNKLYSEDYTQPRTQPVQPAITAGMAGGAPLGQKSVNPMPAQQQPQRMGFDDFEKALGYSLTSGGGGKYAGTMNAIAQFGGNPGALKDTTYQYENANEGGTFMDSAQGKMLDPAFVDSLRSGGYGFELDKTGRHPAARMYDAQGNLLGRQFSVGDSGTKFDNFMEKAVPVGITALAGGTALGAFGGGAGTGAAAAGAGAADIGALGLAEGVYGAGGALGAGVTPGTVGGLAGSTAGFGGLGSVLPSGVGFAAPGALASGAAMDLSTVGGPDPAGLVPNTAPPAAPPYTTAAADSQLASSQLGITGAETAGAATIPTSVNLTNAGGSMLTGAGTYGAASAVPEIFNAAKDSQAANVPAVAGTQPPLPTVPSGVDLGSLGNYSTGGGMVNNIANALEAAKVNPTGTLASAGSSVLDFAKKNPQLAALGASGLAQLAGGSPELPKLPGSGGGSGSAGGVNTPLAGALEQQIGSMGAPDYSGVFGLKNTAGDPNTLNQEAIDAAYSQQTRMLDPQFAREKQAMEARLAEQGFVPGTPGYERAMSIFGEERTKAYGSARDSSIMQGYQIGQGDFRNRLSDTELNNAASRESLAQILAKRNQPFNELASIKGNQQIDYNNQLDRYNAEVSSSNSRNQALSQLALALGMYLG